MAPRHGASLSRTCEVLAHNLTAAVVNKDPQQVKANVAHFTNVVLAHTDIESCGTLIQQLQHIQDETAAATTQFKAELDRRSIPLRSFWTTKDRQHLKQYGQLVQSFIAGLVARAIPGDARAMTRVMIQAELTVTKLDADVVQPYRQLVQDLKAFPDDGDVQAMLAERIVAITAGMQNLHDIHRRIRRQENSSSPVAASARSSIVRNVFGRLLQATTVVLAGFTKWLIVEVSSNTSEVWNLPIDIAVVDLLKRMVTSRKAMLESIVHAPGTNDGVNSVVNGAIGQSSWTAWMMFQLAQVIGSFRSKDITIVADTACPAVEGWSSTLATQYCSTIHDTQAFTGVGRGYQLATWWFTKMNDLVLAFLPTMKGTIFGSQVAALVGSAIVTMIYPLIMNMAFGLLGAMWARVMRWWGSRKSCAGRADQVKWQCFSGRDKFSNATRACQATITPSAAFGAVFNTHNACVAACK